MNPKVQHISLIVNNSSLLAFNLLFTFDIIRIIKQTTQFS